MPARTQPSSGYTWGAMLWVLQVLCPSAESEEPKEWSQAHHCPRCFPAKSLGREEANPHLRLPSESLFLQPQSSWRARKECQFLSGGLCPGPRSGPQPLITPSPHTDHTAYTGLQSTLVEGN